MDHAPTIAARVGGTAARPSAASRLIDLARRARRLPHPALAAALACLFFFGSPILLLGVVVRTLRWVLGIATAPADPTPVAAPVAAAASRLGLYLAAFVPMVLLLWVWLKRYERRPFWTLGFERADAGGKVLRGLLAAAALYLLIVLPFVTVGWVAPEGGPAGQQGMAALGGVLLALLGFAVQGPAEEIIFRGWLLPVVAARARPWLGVAVSALVFALLHFWNRPFSLPGMIGLTLAGVFFALWALWEGGLWGVCAFHAAFNWIEENVLGLGPVTHPDGAVEGGVLVNLRETAAGPDLLTGGAQGLENALALWLLLAAGSVVLAGLLRRRVAPPGPEAG